MNIMIKRVTNSSDLQDSKRYVDAYLRLFNDPENLKYLSFTGIPFERETVETWLRDADASGVEYQTAVGEDGEICAIMVTSANSTEGFEIMGVVVDAGIGVRASRLGCWKSLPAEQRKKVQGRFSRGFADNKKMLALAVKNDFRPYKVEHSARWDGADIVRLKKYLQETTQIEKM
jgi:hypothetical protein